MKKYSSLIGWLAIAMSSWTAANAAAPAGYYSTCEGKSGRTLLTALHNKISDHEVVSYKGLLTMYKTTDVYPDGKIWDMYSTKHWNAGETCGNYSVVGDCYNREHSFPKSWFNDASPMYSDAFHLYPTDGKVNGQRSNYPYGECAGGTTLAGSGSVKALGRLGKSTFPGYSGTVFEPDDEYKGDFARSYFYMAACYNDRISTWKSDMLAGNDFPVFSQWALNLLLKWHRQDPVSDKERNRNDAVYGYQENRNPFIDYPDLIEHIWGDKATEAWSSSGTTTPQFLLPVAGSAVNIGNTSVNTPVSATINVKGLNLKDAVSVSISDSRFSLSATSLTAAAVNASNGANLTVTFSSASKGTASATVTFQSGTASTTVTVSATAYDTLTALDPVIVTDDGFTARWVNIDAPGTNYNLYVAFNSTVLAGYPKSVSATAGSYEVTDLDPSTTYTYWLESSTLQSNVVTVTTGEAIPMINFLFDGDLEFNATPGVPSDIAEVLVDAENIEGNITVSVDAPFEVSTDRTNWSRSITLVENEDRFYLRINAAEDGEYTTSLRATAGTYLNDDATVHATVGEVTQWAEHFSTLAASYNGNATYEGDACLWTMDNAGVFDQLAGDKDLPTGANQSVRFGKNSTSSIAMLESKPRGAGVITYYAHRYSGDADATFALEISTDDGDTWKTVENVTLTSPDWTLFRHNVNVGGNIRLRFRQTAGSRFNLGEVTITDYTISGLESTLQYHSWDAYCLDHSLVVTSTDPAERNVKVYSIDGISRYDLNFSGSLNLSVAPGVYIVVVDDFARRVAIR